MSTAIRIVQRNEQPFDVIQWDGSQEAADWLTEHFENQAAFDGDGDDLSLTFYGSWPIERGWWVLDRWGSPNPMPPENLADFQLPAPAIEVPDLPA